MEMEEIQQLLQRYLAGECNEEERIWVEKWYERLYDSGAEPEQEEIERVMVSRQHELMRKVGAKELNRTEIRPMFSHLKWIAAAVLLLVSVGTFLLLQPSGKKAAPLQIAQDRVAPQKNRATITLANGQTVYLDSTQAGAVVQQGSVRMIKKGSGEIAYEKGDGNQTGELVYNTLTNPCGSRVIEMALEDGSRVWLNAGSAITYPVLFSRDARKVSVEGEAYFEVKPEKKRRFEVFNNGTSVEVLGTKFNVNTFHDDSRQNKITLLEGSVRIIAGKESKLLRPGQQAKVDRVVEVVDGVDLDEVMAWKNGYFTFNNANLQLVLSQIARWYDVEIVYEGQPELREFYGDIQRDLNLSEILKLLEKNGVQFELKGDKLIVKPLKQKSM